jgi:tRNA-specific 2-thiouridylase
MSKKKNIVVGLSGGVDSAVSAYLLKKQGHHVTGVFMQNWLQDDHDEYCSIKEDALDAIAVADCLGIDINIINFSQEYQDKVFKYFLQEYQEGRTPNPDIFCNSEIKFKAFLEYALNSGADAIATGHYARNIEGNLYKGIDQNKDQSYFLYRLSPFQLSKALFPLGDLTKSQVRAIASDLHLPVAHKKDSTGICFIGERPFRQFLSQYFPLSPGDMVTPEGDIVGKHSGLMYYTLGQRKGLGIGGKGAPWFVAQKDIKRNHLIVVQGHDHPLLFSNSALINHISWTTHDMPIIEQKKYGIKTRYRMKDAPGLIKHNKDNVLGTHQHTILFDTPHWSVTPGQSAVIYDGDHCLGGGIII